jgi:F0F1-type ATP synthase gamma subunit
MGNVLDLRRRIRSVKNTRQITVSIDTNTSSERGLI